MKIDTVADRTSEESAAARRVVHLRRGGTSVVVDLDAAPLPAVVHWGEELPHETPATLASLSVAAMPQRVSGGLDTTGRLDVLPAPSAGWFGTPALEGHRAGSWFSPAFVVETVEADDTRLALSLVDTGAELAALLELSLGPAGVLRQRVSITNTGSTAYTVQSLVLPFPVPWDATELFDTTGRHLKERSPQRRAFTYGTHVRDSRRGRPGSDATLLLAAGRPGFGFEHGRVHGIHVAWSGSHRALAERVPTGEAFLAGGELLAAGELILAPGESYASPWVLGSWGDGLTALSARFHDELRARPQHPRRARPVTLNTWEAVYFDHDLSTLAELAQAAAGVGVERFVLDDGWFLGRRDDTAGLGDWIVDPDVWPDGLHPLVDVVHGLGMEFGLWVEPEMVNPDSDLARAHPEWLLHARHELPASARQQQVLDLSNPDAYAAIADGLHALLDEYDIAYLKWDHNRDLIEAGAGPGGASRVHAHTLALYRLLDELKDRHPGLEIETCASGGSRVDLGILERTDRVWTSDTLDPLERLDIQRYTSLVVAPELLGTHLTSPHVHSTRRTASLGLSGAVALFGHFGIEWDLTSLDEAGRARVAEWVALAKRVRPLVTTGRLVFADTAEAGTDIRGVVAADGSHAFFSLVQAQTDVAWPPGRVRLPGLDPARRYRVEIIVDPEAADDPGQSVLAWTTAETVLSGAQLAATGFRPPVQHPGRAVVLELTAVP
ncbi:alpha-galactosidase [Microbacterium sp. RU33B]|uniref:alpha-galactosidase n=1 Tax=Microbacterium sp. RU33B TaxID=1907390 RepID=UPI0009639BA5|nr:alpha-galactosidase [Microbacterium sp. RU33B]SIT77829.1 alpha-galactosidase [Microbacterium sp. RU33B]